MIKIPSPFHTATYLNENMFAILYKNALLLQSNPLLIKTHLPSVHASVILQLLHTHWRRVAAIKQSRNWFHCQVKPEFLFQHDGVHITPRPASQQNMCISKHRWNKFLCVCAHTCIWTDRIWNQGKLMERAARTLLCFMLRFTSVKIDFSFLFHLSVTMQELYSSLYSILHNRTFQ